jgi:hypothetical protein
MGLVRDESRSFSSRAIGRGANTSTIRWRRALGPFDESPISVILEQPVPG